MFLYHYYFFKIRSQSYKNYSILQMLSASSLTGWKSSSNMYDPAPAPATSSRTPAASSSSSSVFSPSSLISQMSRKLSLSPRASPASPPRGSPAPESIVSLILFNKRHIIFYVFIVKDKNMYSNAQILWPSLLIHKLYA